MKQLIKQEIIYILIAIIVIWVWLLLISSKTKADEDSRKISELHYELNEIMKQKEKCYDNLSYKESVQIFEWKSVLCSEYDEQIMNLQSEIEQMSNFYFETMRNLEWQQPLESELVETQQERIPWAVSWDHQIMPDLNSTDSHNRFKEMAEAYWLSASQIWQVENHYGIKEWVVLCITVAETSWWHNGAWWKNIWSVGSNDRGDRPTFALMETGLEWIAKTLTNRYLWKKQTLWCLSNAGSCKEQNDNGKRYATSTETWEKNMVACLSNIYWPINPSDFNIRR